MASDSITGTMKGNQIEVVFTSALSEAVSGAVQWSFGADSTEPYYMFNDEGAYIRKIKWSPSAANDVLHIRRDTSTGQTLIYWVAADSSDQRIEYFDADEKIKPYVLAADQTITTEASVKLELVIA